MTAAVEPRAPKNMVHLVTHSLCLGHDQGPGHPERPDRVRAILAALRHPRWRERLTWHDAPEASREELLRVHPAGYLDRLEHASARGGARFDPDTVTNAASWSAAVRAAGAAVLAVRLALEGRGNGFAPIRPPGHHAEAARAMGFCLLNNVVIAARWGLAAGASRVLIVDWDVHHGNGTQALVEQEPAVRFISLHQWPLYPGTGRENERGVGNLWNLPRPPGLSRARYVGDLLAAIDQATAGWPPALTLVSAGFDSMAGDPLGSFPLEPDDYVTVTQRLRAIGAPIVAVLEGGYSLTNLVAGVEALVPALA